MCNLSNCCFKADLRRYAFRLISDYLAEDTAKEFSKIFGIDVEVEEDITSLTTLVPIKSSGSGAIEDSIMSPIKEEKIQVVLLIIVN